jgi:PKD repeat protein
VTVAQSVSFSAAATGVGTLTYAWNFGDGSTGSGANPTHTYTAPGQFTAKVSVSDGVNPAVTATVSVTVTAAMAVVGSGPDSDGDGFSDAFELAAGSDPNNYASTPTGQPITAGALQPLTMTSASIKLNFAKTGADTISFAGTLAVPNAFNPSNAKVLFDVGGIPKVLTLTSKGSAVSGNDSVKLTIKSTKGVVSAQTSKYAVTFKNGAYAATLANAGLTNATASAASVHVTFTFIFNNTVLQDVRTMSYTAKMGKSGAAK